MALQGILTNFTTCNNTGSFTLTKLWIEKAEELQISATAVSVMTALLWHYNPSKKYVFPHQETIAKRVKRSVATVKRAIAELKQEGYIVSSRTRNGNLYAFTKKFFELFEPSESQLCTEPQAHFELSMDHEHVREQRTNNVVVLKNFNKGAEEETQKELSSTTSFVSSKVHFDLKVIPDILKAKAESGEIRNLQGYWASLRPQVKQEYWEKDTAQKLKIQKQAELKEQQRQERIRKQQEQKELKAELEKPLNEQFTREQAISFCSRLYGMKKILATQGIAGNLIKIYNIQEGELQHASEN